MIFIINFFFFFFLFFPLFCFCFLFLFFVFSFFNDCVNLVFFFVCLVFFFFFLRLKKSGHGWCERKSPKLWLRKHRECFRLSYSCDFELFSSAEEIAYNHADSLDSRRLFHGTCLNYSVPAMKTVCGIWDTFFPLNFNLSSLHTWPNQKNKFLKGAQYLIILSMCGEYCYFYGFQFLICVLEWRGNFHFSDYVSGPKSAIK